MNSQTVVITEELLNALVAQLTKAPWFEATPLLDRLGSELEQKLDAPTQNRIQVP